MEPMYSTIFYFNCLINKVAFMYFQGMPGPKGDKGDTGPMGMQGLRGKPVSLI